MKPLSLSITGLHSFREQQVIDFAALTDTGMFGIFGPTGSGKSTILDALTLALYGDVGRADHNTQAILNHAEKRLQVCLEFEIGGANDRKRYRVERVYKRAEGFSVLHQSSRLLELEPPGEGEHEGVGGKGEASEFGQVVIADSKNAVNQSVRDILGLDQSDFTRAVVLPQGRFAEFLQLTGSERNRMTERLFGLERFGQVLTDKVKDRLDGVQRELATLLAGQQELGDASQTALIAAELTRDEATAALQQATLDLVQAQENQAQAKRVWELQEQATVAQAALESHAKQAATVAVVRKTLALAERALRVWPKVQAAQTAQVDLEQWRHTEEDAVAVEANLSAALVGAQTQWQDLQARQTAEEPVLLQRQGQLQDGLVQEEELRLRQREQLEAEVAHQQALANQAEAQTRLTVAQQALMKLHAGIKQAQQELDSHSVAPKRRQRLLALQEAATQWQRQLETQRQARANLVGRQEMLKQAQIVLAQRVQLRDDLIARLGQARGQLDELGALPPGPSVELATWDAWLAELRPLVQAFKQAEQAAQQAQRVAQGLTTATEQQGILAQQARGKANQAQSVLANLREQREQQIHQDELGMAQRLAGHLQPGCPCPVCGSAAHPHPALRQQPDLDETETGRTWEQWGADIAVAEGAWQAAEQGARQAEGELTRYEATLLAAGREALQRDKEASAARSSLTTTWQRGIATGLFEFLQATGLSSLAAKRDVGKAGAGWDGLNGPATGDAWGEALVLLEQAIATLWRRRQDWQQQLDSLEQAAATLTLPLQEASNQVAGAEQRVLSAEQEVQNQGQGLDQATVGVAVASQHLQAALTAADLVCVHLEQSGMALVVQEMERMAEDDRLAQVAQTHLVELRQFQESQQVEVGTASEELKKWDMAANGTVLRCQQLADEVAQRQQRLARLTGGVAVTVAEAAATVERNLASLRAAVTQAASDVMVADARLREAAQLRAQATANQQAANRQYEWTSKAMHKALAEEQFATPEEVADALLDEVQWQQRTTQVKQYVEQGVKLAAVCEDLARQRAGRSLNESEWQTVQASLSRAQEIYESAVAAQGFANSRLQDIQSRQARWQVLEVQRQVLVHQMGHLESLRNLLRGNSFVEFMARAQMNGVARQASERLQTLTRGRYALELMEDGGFLMRDDHNGGVVRPVSTLSGGETFLTSLALALSLSAHIQLRGRYPLEFFFLDEGFGTLDPDVLDVVVTTLEKLHLERMSIGIISHVPELRQRLQRRLIVEPAQPAGRGTRLWLERA